MTGAHDDTRAVEPAHDVSVRFDFGIGERMRLYELLRERDAHVRRDEVMKPGLIVATEASDE